MNRLESRCRLLLRAYPAGYRAERGEEIIATILESAPASSSWPPAREAWSLIAGGLRVRSARNRQLPLAASLRLAALLAAAIWLAGPAGGALSQVPILGEAVRLRPLSAALFAIYTAGACAAIVSAWFWRRSITITLALTTAAASAATDALAYVQYAGHHVSLLPQLYFGVIGPALALAALATGRERLPRNWLWLPGIWLSGSLASGLLASTGLRVGSTGEHWLVLWLPLAMGVGIGGITLLWAVTDLRPAITVGMFCEVVFLQRSLLMGFYASGGQVAIQALIMTLIAALIVVMAFRMRRTAKT